MRHILVFIICLISLIPGAAGAQEAVALSASGAAKSAAGAPSLTQPQIQNLLPATTLPTTADTAQNACIETAPERSRASQSSFEWGNFAEVHLGGYRWIWWAGAAAALVAIHAGH